MEMCIRDSYNVIIVSVIAALVVAVFAGTDILPLITDSYMTKFADFAKNNFMIFLLSAVFGKLMGDSGAADTIAYSMLRVVNHVHSQRTKQLVGGLMITAIVAVLTYGGVSLFVVIFTLISIGRKLFEELDIPWRHYLTFHGIGSATLDVYKRQDRPGAHRPDCHQRSIRHEEHAPYPPAAL